ncbi:MAG: hypothetical protein ACYC3I_01900 [Gemmataceae bacterium]
MPSSYPSRDRQGAETPRWQRACGLPRGRLAHITDSVATARRSIE